MQYSELAPNLAPLSQIGFGTYQTVGTSLDRTDSIALINKAYDLGVTHFDTADSYGNGLAEQILGEALKSRDPDSYVIATKCYFPCAHKAGSSGLSAFHINRSIDQSLKDLGRDTIDILTLHRFDPETPLEETLAALHRAQRDGKLKHWAVSRWTAENCQAAKSIARKTGLSVPLFNQYFYNAFSRQIDDLFKLKTDNICPIMGYAALAQGVLSGKYKSVSDVEGKRAANHDQREAMWDLTDEKIEAARTLQDLATSLNVSLPRAMIGWCLKNPRLVGLLIGATSATQIEDLTSNADDANYAEIYAAIDRLKIG